MPQAIADGVHIAGTFARAGMLRPSRPDRTLRALVGLHRWGPTLAAGYLGAAARYPGRRRRSSTSSARSASPTSSARPTRWPAASPAYGVQPGHGVAIMCRNHRWFVEASIACSKLGAHAIYLNTSFAGPQVTEVVAREAPAAIIYDEEFAARRPGRPPRPRRASWPGPTAMRAAARPLAELTASRSAAPLPPPADPGRTVILTSGTTGTPKGANRASPDLARRRRRRCWRRSRSTPGRPR